MRALFVLALGALAFPCATPPPPTQVVALDKGFFAAKVEPELIASCAYSTCHGAPLRPMRVFSLAGLRDTNTQCLTAQEHEANFLRASASASPTSSGLPDLLRKPLQFESGGAGHGGVDRFGRNVYANKDAAGWKLLEAWVNGATLAAGEDGGWFDPACATEPEEPDDGGMMMGSDGGVGPMACMPSVGNSYAPVAAIVVTSTCAKEAGCHTPENKLDAGCFVADNTCESLRMAGCLKRSVIPCDLRRSKLLQYTGPPWGVKAHQGVLNSMHAAAIADWIDGGASCDGGGPFP
ncbi:MAG: hypothetical protein U0228_35750 [Myxococcaceae bacterium]